MCLSPFANSSIHEMVPQIPGEERSVEFTNNWTRLSSIIVLHASMFNSMSCGFILT
ncbi:hypothetical protein MPTK1_Vg00555 [Marchantia polymorpha subsp. ruderalis]|nr:hypothetical protein Mp_Vg00555 [Marchantia polymorpha subsp. ruderalis]